MWVPLLRMVGVALRDPTLGVNGCIKQLPVDSGDERPPPVKKIKVVVDDRGLMEDPPRIGPEFPVIAVRMAGPMVYRSVSERLLVREAIAPILLTYGSGEADDDEAARFGLWTQWAIMECLTQWIGRTTPTAPKTRNLVTVVKLSPGEAGAETGEFLEEAADGLITSATTVALTVKNTFLAT